MPPEQTNATDTAPNPGTGEGKGAQPSTEPNGTGAGGASGAERPEGLPEHFWDADKGAPKLDDLISSHRDLEGWKASVESLAAQVPEKADGYSIELPEGIDLGKDANGNPIKWQPDENDPLLGPAREWALENRIPQAAFTKLLSVYAQGQAAAIKADQETLAKEREAMGAKADERVEAATKVLEAILPKGEAAELKAIMQFADGLSAVERLISMASGPGAGRSGGESGVSKPDLSTMSMAEKEKLAEEQLRDLTKNLYQ